MQRFIYDFRALEKNIKSAENDNLLLGAYSMFGILDGATSALPPLQLKEMLEGDSSFATNPMYVLAHVIYTCMFSASGSIVYYQFMQKKSLSC